MVILVWPKNFLSLNRLKLLGMHLMASNRDAVKFQASKHIVKKILNILHFYLKMLRGDVINIFLKLITVIIIDFRIFFKCKKLNIELSQQ